MTPEEKDRINKFLKAMGSDKNVDELETMRKRAVNTLEEWCTQNEEQRKALPLEVRDMRMLCRYILFSAMSGMASIEEAFIVLDKAGEAIYNLGQMNKPKK